MTVLSDLGYLAEKIAAQDLKSRDYKILDHNYRKPWGEIDIVASKDKTMVFVEVKANRYSASGFDAELRVDRFKLQKVIRTARTYLIEKRYRPDQEWQIDVISVTFDKNRGVANIKHFKNV